MSDANVEEQNTAAAPGNLPVPVSLPTPAESDDTFIAEFANMDLDPLRDLIYLVSVSTGDRNKGKFLSTTARGPYDFLEMVEEVGYMWEKEQHHAKVSVLAKDRTKAVRFLDQKTTDYLEANYLNIVAEGILEGAIANAEPFTHTATIVENNPEEDPRMVAAAIPAAAAAAAEAQAQDDEDDDL